MRTKYIFVTGGVVSGLGKGIAAASLGRLLKQRASRQGPKARPLLECRSWYHESLSARRSVCH